MRMSVHPQGKKNFFRERAQNEPARNGRGDGSGVGNAGRWRRGE